jgi:DNA-binding transcriptional LysR family regulator
MPAGATWPKATLVTQNVPLRVHLLANGQHITEFTSSTLKLYADRYGLMALPVDLPDRPWPVVIATLKNRTLNPVVERFITCAREVTKSFVNDE